VDTDLRTGNQEQLAKAIKAANTLAESLWKLNCRGDAAEVARMAALLDEALGTLTPDAAMWADDNSAVLLKLKKGVKVAEELLEEMTARKEVKPDDLVHSLAGNGWVEEARLMQHILLELRATADKEQPHAQVDSTLRLADALAEKIRERLPRKRKEEASEPTVSTSTGETTEESLERMSAVKTTVSGADADEGLQMKDLKAASKQESQQDTARERVDCAELDAVQDLVSLLRDVQTLLASQARANPSPSTASLDGESYQTRSQVFSPEAKTPQRSLQLEHPGEFTPASKAHMTDVLRRCWEHVKDLIDGLGKIVPSGKAIVESLDMAGEEWTLTLISQLPGMQERAIDMVVEMAVHAKTLKDKVDTLETQLRAATGKEQWTRRMLEAAEASTAQSAGVAHQLQVPPMPRSDHERASSYSETTVRGSKVMATREGHEAKDAAEAVIERGGSVEEAAIAATVAAIGAGATKEEAAKIANVTTHIVEEEQAAENSHAHAPSRLYGGGQKAANRGTEPAPATKVALTSSLAMFDDLEQSLDADLIDAMGITRPSGGGGQWKAADIADVTTHIAEEEHATAPRGNPARRGSVGHRPRRRSSVGGAQSAMIAKAEERIMSSKEGHAGYDAAEAIIESGGTVEQAAIAATVAAIDAGATAKQAGAIANVTSHVAREEQKSHVAEKVLSTKEGHAGHAAAQSVIERGGSVEEAAIAATVAAINAGASTEEAMTIANVTTKLVVQEEHQHQGDIQKSSGQNSKRRGSIKHTAAAVPKASSNAGTEAAAVVIAAGGTPDEAAHAAAGAAIEEGASQDKAADIAAEAAAAAVIQSGGTSAEAGAAAAEAVLSEGGSHEAAAKNAAEQAATAVMMKGGSPEETAKAASAAAKDAGVDADHVAELAGEAVADAVIHAGGTANDAAQAATAAVVTCGGTREEAQEAAHHAVEHAREERKAHDAFLAEELMSTNELMDTQIAEEREQWARCVH